MPIEIEAKMRLDDIEAMIARLDEAGAVRGPTRRETNVFFDTPEHTLKSSDQGLRVRVEQREDGPGRDIIVTHKGPRAHGPLKSRAETEVHVDDADHAAALLAALGYHVQLSFEKRRQTCSVGGCAIAVDQLPYLGDFIEIEGPDDQTVLAVRAKLGLDNAAIIRASYIAMLQTYLAEHDIHDTHIALEAAGRAV